MNFAWQLSSTERSRVRELGVASKLRLELPRLVRGRVQSRRVQSAQHLRSGRGVRIRRSATAEIRLGRFVLLNRDVHIDVFSVTRPAVLTIGERTSIGAGSTIEVASEVQIGSGCALANECIISDTDWHTLLDLDGQPAHGPRAPVTIEDHVWMGYRVIVLKGVRIGEGAVIGAGSLVTRDIPPRVLAAGVPARPMREIGGWR